MKNWEVVIDIGSFHFYVKAKNESEAKQKAIIEFEKLNPKLYDIEYWVGDVEEM